MKDLKTECRFSLILQMETHEWKLEVVRIRLLENWAILPILLSMQLVLLRRNLVPFGYAILECGYSFTFFSIGSHEGELEE